MQCCLFFLVHKDGEVCISILHEPGEDKFGYERASERWLPIHTVESILMSVISMISDPNDESPANVDAAVSTAFFPVISQVVISLPSCPNFFYGPSVKYPGHKLKGEKQVSITYSTD